MLLGNVGLILVLVACMFTWYGCRVQYRLLKLLLEREGGKSDAYGVECDVGMELHRTGCPLSQHDDGKESGCFGC